MRVCARSVSTGLRKPPLLVTSEMEPDEIARLERAKEREKIRMQAYQELHEVWQEFLEQWRGRAKRARAGLNRIITALQQLIAGCLLFAEHIGVAVALAILAALANAVNCSSSA